MEIPYNVCRYSIEELKGILVETTSASKDLIDHKLHSIYFEDILVS